MIWVASTTRKPNSSWLKPEREFVVHKNQVSRKKVDFKQEWIKQLINVLKGPLLLFSCPAFFHDPGLILLLAPIWLSAATRYLRLDSPRP